MKWGMCNQFALIYCFAIGVVSLPVAKAIALPASVFGPYLNRIQQDLPEGYQMRLPARIHLGGAVPLNPDDLIVRVFPSQSPPRLTVSLFTCEGGPYPCLVGSFSVDSLASENAQREFSRHQSFAMPVTLAPQIQGYVADGSRQSPPNAFSSIMWQQSGMFYTVSFLAHERQNILNMAASMAWQEPIQKAPVTTLTEPSERLPFGF